MRRRPTGLVLGLLLFVSLAGLAYWAFDDWQFRSELADLRREVAQSRFAKAWPRVVRLAARRPDDGELQYDLGLCESALGREDDAVKAWTRVPAGSSFEGRAAIQRARRELARHHLAAAEVLLPKAVADRGDHSLEAFETLLNLYKIEGRFAEATRLAWNYADRYPDSIALLRELAQLASVKPHRLDLIRSGLETASRAAPDDDRVWLGWANLATRLGQYDDAARWLDRCQKARPDDAAVWHARLDLAVAVRDVEAAWRAVEHLSSAPFTPAEVLTLAAWFASLEPDKLKEQWALTELVALEPSNSRALDRLAELELKSGHPQESTGLRVRKAELSRAKSQYDILLSQSDAGSQAVPLARLAETLELFREAKMLWSYAAKQNPRDPAPAEALARLSERSSPPPPAGSTLTALLATRPEGGNSTGRGAVSIASIARPVFSDDAESVGLRFFFENGSDPLQPLPQTMSGGVGLLDFDGDGWLDVYCVQGGSSFSSAGVPTSGDRLFRNRGDGTFVDVSAASKIEAMPRGYGHGVAVGDFDNDGRPDLFVTRMDSYALYRNQGDGTFADVTEAAGLGGPRDWPTSAAFADLDGDGDLDLYVCHYLEWDSKHPRLCTDPLKQKPVICEPLEFRSMPDHLFRNDGGKFVDITAEAGIVDTHGQGLGVVACDFDKDGRLDLFVANDQSANYLYRNLGGLRFQEVGETTGVGSNAEGAYQANMGIACGDLNGDGLPDLAVTEYYNEGATYYQNLGGGVFSDQSRLVGLQAPTRSLLGFGIAFLDHDANGTLDLAIANGHVADLRPTVPYLMPTQLLAGTKNGKFVDLTARAGPAWQTPRIGRGLATGDLDNDGRVDVLVLSQNQPLAYLHNKTEGGHWLILRLEGVKSNRDAVGTKVTINSRGTRQTAWRFGGGSYQSASDTRLHFGLGEVDRIDEVEVTWPSGQIERFDGFAVDHAYLLREGEKRSSPLAGYK